MPVGVYTDLDRNAVPLAMLLVMYTLHPLASIGLFVCILFLAFTRFYRKRRVSIGMIRGPPSPSWFLGHQYMLRHAKNVGDYEASWYRDYGSVFRIAGVFNDPVLLISDPKALQYVLQASGYHFPKSLDTKRMIEAFFGHGLLAANNQDHHRQRKILNPAFSNGHLQCYLDVFQAAGSKLVQKLKEEIWKDGHGTENMLVWAQKATLDVIGITSFRYSFGALDDMNSAFEEVLCHLFAEAQLSPSVADVLFSQGALRYLPECLMPILARLPTREHSRYQDFRKAIESVARTIYHRELELVKDGIEEGKDIINILAHSSLSNDERKRMTESEIAAQMGTFTFAGHDTTANTLAWLLYELSCHPEDQDKIRQEISQVPGGVLTCSDYDAMPWLNASIKETLRLHPFAHVLVRVAGNDDAIPLLDPITTHDGKVLKEIPVAEGQTIHISTSMYNRNPSVWGKDAHEWNPKRFLEDKHRETSLGVYANLMTFSAGARSCIGWRFAIMELQALAVELLSAFEFSIPVDSPAIIHAPGSQCLFPVLEDRPEEGVQMPLRVAIRGSE